MRGIQFVCIVGLFLCLFIKVIYALEDTYHFLPVGTNVRSLGYDDSIPLKTCSRIDPVTGNILSTWHMQGGICYMQDRPILYTNGMQINSGTGTSDDSGVFAKALIGGIALVGFYAFTKRW
jgi:hypothetical protein